jgi:hypothetical protein
MSEVLSAQDIDDLREAVSDIFPDRADIYRRAEAETEGQPGGDEWGGYTPTHPGDLGGNPDLEQVPVLYGVRSAVELQRLAAQGVNIDQAFTFPGGTEIRQTDQIHVRGEVYEVTAVGGGGAWEVTLPVGGRRIS